ncbi:AlpA family transcriptional regulator [Achromobacter spanius]|uniref:AlpA family transcriptional regulator n=1 Tax=Achromobacter spanius TaxID=217203 RepID=A0A2S5GIP9_9BURK|nr:AlpA family phage regulatory protein [Achromobacter spanius]PPA72838.1 AlpA family transcriptional regulator [Achromobacter spanius]
MAHAAQHQAPAAAPKLVYRIGDVSHAVGLSKTEIYRRIKAGTFPKGTKISPQVSIWNPDEVRDWAKKQFVPSDVP